MTPVVVVRAGVVGDVDSIAALHQQYNARATDKAVLFSCVESYPSAVAYVDDVLVGFAYCGSFAPDVLELRNLLVAPGVRRQSVGERLLQLISQDAQDQFNAIILVNSPGYGGIAHPSAVGFYLRQGFVVLHETPSSSTIMLKTL